jgi:CRP-like cAMP-binding protein
MTLTHTHNAKNDLIQTVSLFSDRPNRELDLIASMVDIVDVPEGKQLMREGDRGREFFALVDGTADVTRRGQLLSTLGPGDFFGEIALVARMPRTASVTTTSPARVLVLTDQAFRRLIEIDPEIRLRVLGSFAERVGDVTL